MKLSLPKQTSRSKADSRPFSAGLASVFVLLPDMRGRSFARRVLKRSDTAAIKSDWQDVGGDMRGAIDSSAASLQTDKGQMAFEWSGCNGS